MTKMIPAQFVPARLAPVEQAAIAKAMDDLRHTQPWSYYSTLLIEDFGQVTSQVLSFWQTTRGTPGYGYAMTNLVQPGQIPEAFRVYGISVRVAISLYDDPRIFELLTNFCAIEMKVGADEMIVGPVTSFPAGGGVTGMIELGPQPSGQPQFIPIPIPQPIPIPVPGGGAPSPAAPPSPGGGAQPLLTRTAGHTRIRRCSRVRCRSRRRRRARLRRRAGRCPACRGTCTRRRASRSS